MEAIVSGLISFCLFHFVSNPKSRIKKRLPRKKISRIQLLPNIHIEAKNRIFHFHHWMIFTPVFLFTRNIPNSFLHSEIVTGFLLGGIIQGLLYQDRFRFVFHQKEYSHKIKRSKYNLSFLKKIV